MKNLKKQGFTLMELLVVIAIGGLVMALLAPAIASTRKSAHMAQCINNLRQISLAALMYADDYDEEIPDTTPNQLARYIDNDDVFVCPADTDLTNVSSYTACQTTPNSLRPSDTAGLYSERILYIESETISTSQGERANIELVPGGNVEDGAIEFRHNNRTVMVFADGHITSMNVEQFVAAAFLFPDIEVPADP